MDHPPFHELLFYKAASFGNLPLLKHLAAIEGEKPFLEKCKSVTICGMTVLHCVASEGKTHICKFLLEKIKMNVDIKSDQGETPLYLAVMGGHLPTAAYFIRRGADIDATDFNGETPLHCAAKKGHKKLMQLLISHGADIEAIHDDCTPIQAAALIGNKQVVRILLEHNANPNSAPPLSVTPVMMSIIGRSIECLDILLKAGADPNLSAGGMTPLACAASEVETKYMKSLLRAGANPNSVDVSGLTPIEHAAMTCNYAGVMTLFPVTSCIPSIPDWSIHGIMSYVHSDEGEEQIELKKKENFLLAKKRGEEAVKRKDYLNAVFCYTEAHHLYPTDAAVLSNRSLCWANLKEGKQALCDAQTCAELRPDWPKAHYRGGVALMLLKNYSMASEAFSEALRLDPKNKEVQKAFKEAVETEICMPVADNIAALHI